MPAVSSLDFAADLAARLDDVVPARFAVTADQEKVVLLDGGEVVGSTGMADLVESSENLDDLPENLMTAARAILSNVQDWIAETSGGPWPGERSQPNPDARIAGSTLRMWFGDGENPILELAPLELIRLNPGTG